MIRIVNRRTYRGEGIYIGRPSLLGNPYKCQRVWKTGSDQALLPMAVGSDFGTGRGVRRTEAIGGNGETG